MFIVTKLHLCFLVAVTVASVCAVKVGKCPAFFGQTTPNSPNFCRRDDDCAGSRKCCRTMSGYRCLLPESDTATCPDGSVSNMRCTHNRCPVGMSCRSDWCCPLAGKAGSCPPAPSLVIGTASDQCASDASCELDRKCCMTTTGRRCLLPDKGQGICPDGSRSNERCPTVGTCRDGFFCSKNYCCPYKGSQADNELCPVNQPPGYENGRFCLSHADCKPRGLCCKYGGLSKCYDPASPPTGGAGGNYGTCPAFSGEMISGATHTCNYDGDCDASRKCCPTVSGRRCLKPE